MELYAPAVVMSDILTPLLCCKNRFHADGTGVFALSVRVTDVTEGTTEEGTDTVMLVLNVLYTVPP